ncbi:MAG: alkaline phosphatase PhoX [Phycisphaerales bacterium JB052]
MSSVSRRHFLTRSSSVALGFAGLSSSLARGSTASLLARLADSTATNPALGFGPLIEDPRGIIALPEGFSYTLFSRTGERMDDGLSVPGKHDAMGAFPYINDDGSTDPDRTILIRNHEIEDAHKTTGPFRHIDDLLGFDQAKLYDPGFNRPSRGGTTTMVYNTKTRKLEGHWMSLAGTERNCAGGITPRNTWLTCEETASVKGERFEYDHGYVFEVPATTSPALADPKPIKAMGRFMHEACCTDPRTGIVYQTEDRHDGLIYRYVPNNPDDLHQGGKLQALRVDHTPSFDTRNWDTEAIKPNEPVTVSWITLDEVESPSDDLRYRGFNAGAARFARGEGMWWGNDGAYFAATTGGKGYHGQIWRIVPDPETGVDHLELFIEPNDPSVLHRADNICFSPWGDLIVCEDENEPPRMIGVTMQGELYVLGRNAQGNAEFAGATFSADGSTLFVNVQTPGYTLAITGPWEQVRQ